MKKINLTILFVAFFSHFSIATIINVPSQYPTIQAGIDVAVDGDTVLVADGTYTGTSNKNIDFGGQAIVVMSENGAENCIIDCEGDGRGFYFHSGEDINSVVDGFKIINGNGSETGGGGISCIDSSSPIIINCIINNNTATSEGAGIKCSNNSNPFICNCIISDNITDSGAGIHCTWSNPTITNCSITNNTATTSNGGGILCSQSDPIIENCTITGNIALNDAGGIQCMWSDPIIKSSVISQNTASVFHGGGIDMIYSSLQIINCTLSGNSAGSEGGGIYCRLSDPVILNTIVESNSGDGGIYFSDSPDVDISYSDFFNNQNGNFNGNSIPGGLGIVVMFNANGDLCDEFYNIFINPLFYSTTGDSAYSLTEDSPCIDAGDPASPLDPDTTIADIGAFYYDQSVVQAKEPKKISIPEEYVLHSPYPNPFNPATTLTFDLPQAGDVSLVVYDVSGREVARLFDGFKTAGSHEVTFDASHLSSGIYFARLVTVDFQQTRKLLLVK